MRKSSASGMSRVPASRTMALPSGCSERRSAAAVRTCSCCGASSGRALCTWATPGVPRVRVPVLSKATTLTRARRSSASPSLTRTPWRVALPMAAMMAVGVASTRAQGQKTTRMVTARSTSPVTIQVPAAAVRAVTTIQVAQRSARLTIRALPASADCTRRIMRCRELSSPTLTARMSKAPNWFTVPLDTVSPGPLSTGRDSPVMTDWSMAVWPLTMMPSTGMVSPGSTRSRSSTRTSSAGMMLSAVPSKRRAVRGVRCTSRSMPARALATVRSSSRAPSCMMKATSPAAKISPMMTDASRASETSTSALMSKRVNRPSAPSLMMGTPHSSTASQAGSTGPGTTSRKLSSRATAEIPRASACRGSSLSHSLTSASMEPPCLSGGVMGIHRSGMCGRLCGGCARGQAGWKCIGSALKIPIGV